MDLVCQHLCTPKEHPVSQQHIPLQELVRCAEGIQQRVCAGERLALLARVRFQACAQYSLARVRTSRVKEASKNSKRSPSRRVRERREMNHAEGLYEQAAAQH